MYLSDVFNSRGLFQYLGGWVTKLDNGTKPHAHVVLQRAYEVLYHLEQGCYLEHSARSQFETHIPLAVGSPVYVHCWSPLVANLIIELSGALGTIRVLQNDVWKFVTAAVGSRDAPASMRDAYKIIIRKYGTGSKRPKWLAEVPSDMRKAVEYYWVNSGEAVAAYRDVDQHYDMLARGCLLLMTDKVLTRVSVRLPDNPSLKSPTKFTYDKAVDGFNLAQTSFRDLHDLMETLAQIADAPRAALQQVMEFVPPIAHEPGAIQTTGLILFDPAGKTGLVIGQDAEMHVTYMPITKEK